METVRYTYRLRPGVQDERALVEEWGRCRYLWNEAVHQFRSGLKPTFGKLSKLLTEARKRIGWLREGSQDAQQQTLRTYAQALHHSFTVKGRGRPQFKKRKGSLPSLSYSRNGFRIIDRRLRLPKGVTVPKSTMARKAADAAVSTIKRVLIEYGVRAGRTVVLVQPAYTTMTCSTCFARAKRLMLDERTFACPSCGLIEDRDRNAAKTILAVAERGHTSVESVRHAEPPSEVSGAA